MPLSLSPSLVMSLLSERRIAALEAALAEERARVAKLTAERDLLLAAHERLRLELEMLRRRIFVAKAERVDTTQLELEFKSKLAELDKLGGAPAPTPAPSDESPGDVVGPTQDGEGAAGPKGPTKKPTGRRDLRKAPLEEERVEIKDLLFEALVAEGKATRIGYEESSKLAWKRGGLRRLVVARVKYRAEDATGEAQIETAPMPAECFPRSLAAPSLLAKIVVDKYCDGLPLHRIEDRFARDGFPVDRGTMCRWVEDAGATVGATVLAAARQEAMRTAFCIATDATGVLVQPARSDDKAKHARKACRRGHYFVLLADKDHVFFEYTPKENSRVVAEMFRGYSGYVQADAKSVYDVLFRGPEEKPPDEDDLGAVRHEVGCWSHCRRKFWEATVAKSAVAREGLARIGRIFALDEGFRRHPPAAIARLRQAYLRPHLVAFFAWAEEQYALVRKERGMLVSALRYAVRQRGALLRVLDDGRLVLENNRSERELRRIAVGRKAWLFVGSDDHAHSAGHLFSLIASARLHRIDPEAYLRDLFRVLAHWPRDRYLELAPKYWAATRARLAPMELESEVGFLTVPPLLPTEEQTTSR
ncbi:MAG TPA: IS66 family transposase [Polyangiaceae bacterium]|nr:IS66 family transposase [Polyangiaceae bacterium]